MNKKFKKKQILFTTHISQCFLLFRKKMFFPVTDLCNIVCKNTLNSTLCQTFRAIVKEFLDI